MQDPWVARVLALIDLERHAKAEQMVRETLAQDPNHPYAPVLLAHILARMVNFFKSTQFAVDPGRPSTREEMRSRQTRIAEALANARVGVVRNPEWSMAHEVLAVTLLSQGTLNPVKVDRPKLLEAVAVAEAAVRVNPDSFSARYSLSLIYTRLRKWETALEPLDQILARDPDHIQGLCARAYILLILRRYDEAAGMAERVLARRPNHPMAWTIRGWVKFMHGKPDAAEADFREALRCQAMFGPARQGLDYARAAYRYSPPFGGLIRWFVTFEGPLRRW